MAFQFFLLGCKSREHRPPSFTVTIVRLPYDYRSYFLQDPIFIIVLNICIKPFIKTHFQKLISSCLYRCFERLTTICKKKFEPFISKLIGISINYGMIYNDKYVTIAQTYIIHFRLSGSIDG